MKIVKKIMMLILSFSLIFNFSIPAFAVSVTTGSGININPAGGDPSTIANPPDGSIGLLNITDADNTNITYNLDIHNSGNINTDPDWSVSNLSRSQLTIDLSDTGPFPLLTPGDYWGQYYQIKNNSNRPITFNFTGGFTSGDLSTELDQWLWTNGANISTFTLQPGETSPVFTAVFGLSPDSSVQNITGNLLWAWDYAIDHTVTFNSNGGSAVSPNTQSVTNGSTATKPSPDPTRDGYTFTGWYTDSATTQPFDFSTSINNDMTLYAGWTKDQWTVNFDSQGGSSVPNQTVTDQDTATKPAPDPTRDGYTFTGWYTDPETMQPFDFSTPITGNKTLYAGWTKNPWTVSFNSQGGSSVPNQIVNDEDTASKPSPDLTRDGYTFNGWYTDADATQPFDFSTPITSDTTLYAGWTKNPWTVTFDSQGGSSVSNQTVNDQDTASKPTDPTRDGYTFNGWYTDADATQPFDFSTPITSDTTLYAGWTKNPWTVSFNSQGGSSVPNQTVDDQKTANKPTPDPNRTGYTFTGWYTDASATQPFDFSTPITGNKTLYAGWAKNPWTVSFNSQGGSSVPNQTVNDQKTANKPVPDPTRPGYTFTGWYTDVTLTQPFDFSTPITSDMTLYAGWRILTPIPPTDPVAPARPTVPAAPTTPATPVAPVTPTTPAASTTPTTTTVPKTWIVTFNPRGGSHVATQTVSHNATITKPAQPTRPGYVFTGWHTDAETTQVYDFTTPVTNHMVLHAGWEPATPIPDVGDNTKTANQLQLLAITLSLLVLVISLVYRQPHS